MAHQVHGADVLSLESPARPGRFVNQLSGWPEGDALVTTSSSLPLLVLAADCVPVLLWRADASGVAAAHAGWRGLIGGVLQNTAASLGGELVAAIGPCVSRRRYEVSDDIAGRFAARFGSQVVDGRHLDLPACARLALQEGGVAPESVDDLERCTASEPGDFFSHRRDGARTGRQGAMIWRTENPPR